MPVVQRSAKPFDIDNPPDKLVFDIDPSGNFKADVIKMPPKAAQVSVRVVEVLLSELTEHRSPRLRPRSSRRPSQALQGSQHHRRFRRSLLFSRRSKSGKLLLFPSRSASKAVPSNLSRARMGRTVRCLSLKHRPRSVWSLL